jgi:hypothetical protein
VELSKEGVGKVHGLGDISEFEQDLLDACLKDLANNIKKVSQISVCPLTACRARNSLRITLELQKVVDFGFLPFLFTSFVGVYLDRLTRYIVISYYFCNIHMILVTIDI